MMLAVGNDKENIGGTLYLLEKEDDEWQQAGSGFPCVFGKNGWARGMKEFELDDDLALKKEGDQKTPMGLFTLRTAYGYASRKEASFSKMPYLAVNKYIKAVDDPASRFYNQIVDERLIENKDWNSAEDMKREDDLYKWGVVINYNTSNIDRQAGSCIYLHLWQDEKSGTAGCTALAEDNFIKILEWLDPEKRPCIIQSPEELLPDLLEKLGMAQK